MSRERHHRAAGSGALRCALTQPGSQRVVIDLDTDSYQRCAHIEELLDVAVTAVDMQGEHIITQDLTDEVGAGTGRAMLDEDTDTVVVGGPDRHREVDGRLGLPCNCCSTVFSADVVRPTDAVRIEPHPRHRRDVARVHVEPGLMELRRDLGNVAGEVVANRTAALNSEGVDDATTNLRITSNDEVAFGVDQHEVDMGLVGDCGTHIVDRGEHVPHGPVDPVDVPSSGDSIEIDGNLVGEHSRRVDLTTHCVHITPHAKGVEHVAFA